MDSSRQCRDFERVKSNSLAGVNKKNLMNTIFFFMQIKQD